MKFIFYLKTNMSDNELNEIINGTEEEEIEEEYITLNRFQNMRLINIFQIKFVKNQIILLLLKELIKLKVVMLFVN